MNVFDVNRGYDPDLDVRDYGSMQDRLERLSHNGVLMPIAASRRGGKTWTLRAMERRMNAARPGSAKYIDLRSYPKLPGDPPAGCLLLDEPQFAADPADRARDAGRFLDWCVKMHGAGTRVVLAMTPAEWVKLGEADRTGARISMKDLQFIRPLQPLEAKRLARTTAAQVVLSTLPTLWCRSPFLLELVFSEAEARPDLAGDTRALLRAVFVRCAEVQIDYVHYVFNDGLTEPQRRAVRRVAWADGDPPEEEMLMLRGCGLVDENHGVLFVADPILEAVLAPLRVHHVSDIHIGPKSAAIGDVKEGAELGDRIKDAVGAELVRDGYVKRLEQLKERGRAPHLLVVSGDIAEWAKREEYQIAQGWLDRVKHNLADHPLLRGDDPRVLVVGGNHDVDWRQTTSADGPQARHVPFAEAFADYPHPHLEKAPGSRPLARVEYADLGVEFVLLGSAELGGEETRNVDEAPILDLLSKLSAQSASSSSMEVAEDLRKRTVRIDPGLVHRSDLDRMKAIQAERRPHAVRVAVLHHPLSPLPAAEVARFGGLLNAGDLKATLLEKGFCLVLHGHVHKGWFAEERWLDRYPAQTLRIAAAPSLASYEVREHNGYNEIEIRRDRRGKDKACTIVVRRFGLDGAHWVPIPGAVMGPFTPGA